MHLNIGTVLFPCLYTHTYRMTAQKVTIQNQNILIIRFQSALMAITYYTGQKNVHPCHIRSRKDTKAWLLCKLEYLEMKFFFRCATTCGVIVLDHVTSKSSTWQPWQSKSHVRHCDQALAVYRNAGEKAPWTPCVVSSSYKTCKTLGNAWVVVLPNHGRKNILGITIWQRSC